MTKALTTRDLKIVVAPDVFQTQPPLVELNVSEEALAISVDWRANDGFWSQVDAVDFRDFDGKPVVAQDRCPSFRDGDIAPQLVELNVSLGRGQTAFIEYSLRFHLTRPVDGVPKVFTVDPIIMIKTGHG